MNAISLAAKIADRNKNMINCKIFSVENLFCDLMENGTFNDIRTFFCKRVLTIFLK